MYNQFHLSFNAADDRQAFTITKLRSLPPRSISVYIGQAVYEYEQQKKNHTYTTNSDNRKRDGQFDKMSDTHALSSVTHKSSEKHSVQTHIEPEQADLLSDMLLFMTDK